MVPLMMKVERHEGTGVHDGERSLLSSSLEGSNVAGYCLLTMSMIIMRFACVL